MDWQQIALWFTASMVVNVAFTAWRAHRRSHRSYKPLVDLTALPVELRRLVHTVDRMCVLWAHADRETRDELFTAVRKRCDVSPGMKDPSKWLP